MGLVRTMRSLWLLVPLMAAAASGIVLPPSQDHVVRQDLANAGTMEGTHRLLRFVQVTDTHLMDDDAPFPLRQEQLDARGAPFTSAQRPQEEYGDEVLASLVGAINAENARDPFDLVVFTGDSIDNDLENELMRFLDVVQGTTTTTGPVSGLVCQPDGASTDTADTQHDVQNACTSLPEGLPHPGLAPGLAWYQVLGNHDKLVQGNVAPIGPLQPSAAQHGRHFLSPAEFVSMHFANHDPCTPGDLGHGFGLADGACTDPAGAGDYAFSVGPIRFVVLDTVSPGATENLPLDQLGSGGSAAALSLFGGHADGTVTQAQKTWLDAQVADHADQLVLIAAHHTLNNLAPPPTPQQHCLFGVCIDSLGVDPASVTTASELAQDLQAHRNVVAWIGGHSHRDHIEPKGGPGAGFWSIETASLIDDPQEARMIELWVTADGAKGFLATQPMPAGNPIAGPLAANDPQRDANSAGGPADRSTVLWFDVPPGIALPPPPSTQTNSEPAGAAPGEFGQGAATSTGETAQANGGPVQEARDALHKVPAPGALIAVLLLALARRRRRWLD